MSALRGLRGVIAPPFYLVVPTAVAAAAAVIVAIVSGTIRGDAPGDALAWREWGRIVAEGWTSVLAGLALGLAAGAIGLQGARPSLASDPAPPWLSRASRTIVAAALGGVAGALAALMLRSYAGQGAAVLLVVLLLVAALLWAVVASLPGYRRTRDGATKSVTSGPL